MKSNLKKLRPFRRPRKTLIYGSTVVGVGEVRGTLMYHWNDIMALWVFMFPLCDHCFCSWPIEKHHNLIEVHEKNIQRAAKLRTRRRACVAKWKKVLQT